MWCVCLGVHVGRAVCVYVVCVVGDCVWWCVWRGMVVWVCVCGLCVCACIQLCVKWMMRVLWLHCQIHNSVLHWCLSSLLSLFLFAVFSNGTTTANRTTSGCPGFSSPRPSWQAWCRTTLVNTPSPSISWPSTSRFVHESDHLVHSRSPLKSRETVNRVFVVFLCVCVCVF